MGRCEMYSQVVAIVMLNPPAKICMSFSLFKYLAMATL